MSDILSVWPFPYDPRKNQIEALKWLEQNQDKRNLILECPVGSGKSNIGITYSLFKTQPKGLSYILTPQKILQEQYEDSFEGLEKIQLASFYGRSNYSCVEKHVSCDIGSVFKPACDFCPYKQARNRAKMNPNTVMNYKLALVSFGFTNFFAKRPLLIMDECHSLEDHLVDFDAVEITERRSEKYKMPFKTHNNLLDALQWIVEEYLPKLKQVYGTLDVEASYIKDKMEGDSITKAEAAKIKEANSVGEHLELVNGLIQDDLNYVESQYVLVHEKTSFAFKRLYGSYTFNHILAPQADQLLYMSSTVLNKTGFCKDLGLDTKETAFLSLPSEFDPSNRPVRYMPHMKMNVSWKKEENEAHRNTLIKTTLKLLDNHKDESGIIHTGNFEIAKWLVSELKGNINHRIYDHNPGGDKRGNVITAFMEDSKPALLISPSITEGLDLKDDLSRFAIIMKVPFGHLGDQWIKRRMDMSSEWYQRRALIDIIQGGGRIVRGPQDKGTVYIMDGSWAYLMHTTSHMIPKWWLEAYKVV